MGGTTGRGTGPAVVDEHRVRGVVAVRLDAMGARADVVVRVAIVGGIDHVEVVGELLVELVPPGERVHVRLVPAEKVRVEVVLSSRITGRRTGLRPTDGDPVRTAILDTAVDHACTDAMRPCL